MPASHSVKTSRIAGDGTPARRAHLVDVETVRRSFEDLMLPCVVDGTRSTDAHDRMHHEVQRAGGVLALVRRQPDARPLANVRLDEGRPVRLFAVEGLPATEQPERHFSGRFGIRIRRSIPQPASETESMPQVPLTMLDDTAHSTSCLGVGNAASISSQSSISSAISAFSSVEAHRLTIGATKTSGFGEPDPLVGTGHGELLAQAGSSLRSSIQSGRAVGAAELPSLDRCT